MTVAPVFWVLHHWGVVAYSWSASFGRVLLWDFDASRASSAQAFET
jgi:hypothetical protein